MECELCLEQVETLQQAEIHGSVYWVCNACVERYAEEIRRGIAEDMAGADAAEREQEER